jgi:signal transduction histidine kinase
LPPDLRHNIFLIVKEALTNALKHAAAREVSVQATVVANTLEIVVRDDGRGFAPAKVTPPAGRNGLGNMRRRANHLEGALEIISVPDQGTAIKLRVTLPGPSAGAGKT